MVPGMSPCTSRTSLVTLWVLTTSYLGCLVEAHPRLPFFPRRSGAGVQRFLRGYLPHQFCSSAVFRMSCSKMTATVTFEASSSQTQQRWAGRPVPPPLSLINTASCLAIISSTFPVSRFTAPPTTIAPGLFLLYAPRLRPIPVLRLRRESR